MSDYAELVSKLRAWSKDMRLFGNADQDVREAAYTIEQLEARAEQAEEKLDDTKWEALWNEAAAAIEERNDWKARAERAEAERDQLYNERHLFVIDKERQALQARAEKAEATLKENDL